MLLHSTSGVTLNAVLDLGAEPVRKAFERFLAAVTSNPISLAGSALTTVTAFLFLLLFSIHIVSEHGASPYLGILTFLILPGLFLLGLALIPLGLWRARKRRLQALAEDDPAVEFAVLDFNRPSTRKAALIFLAATGINALILGVGTYKGVEVMESTQFCGAACHTVMEPEFTTYKRSPHARVKCVECHIGEGADWFVKSKLSGSWQLVSVAFDLYEKPIGVPVHNLRPARETCEQCHWPNKFVGDRFKVNTHFSEDEANTETKTVLVVKVGGRQAGRSQGIHWHVDPDHVVRYRSDEKRQVIYEVEVETKDGTKQRFAWPAACSPEAAKATEWRTMDCVDCHNRPSHVYRDPERELDAALLDRRIDPALPFVRREGLKALQAEYPSHEAAREGIAKAIAELLRPVLPAGGVREEGRGRRRGPGARRHLGLERLPEDERQVGHVQEPHRPLPRHEHGSGLLPLPQRGAQDRRREGDLAGLHDLPLAARPGREGPGDPEDDPQQLRSPSEPQTSGLARELVRSARPRGRLRRRARSRIIGTDDRNPHGGFMAKARRTTHRSSAGKKLYAVRDADGKFKDIQTYERAHRADLAKIEGRDREGQEEGRQEEGGQEEDRQEGRQEALGLPAGPASRRAGTLRSA